MSLRRQPGRVTVGIWGRGTESWISFRGRWDPKVNCCLSLEFSLLWFIKKIVGHVYNTALFPRCWKSVKSIPQRKYRHLKMTFSHTIQYLFYPHSFAKKKKKEFIKKEGGPGSACVLLSFRMAVQGSRSVEWLSWAFVFCLCFCPLFCVFSLTHICKELLSQRARHSVRFAIPLALWSLMDKHCRIAQRWETPQWLTL